MRRDREIVHLLCSYVSRAHLVLERQADSGLWTLVCNGKNGVFIDHQLAKKTVGPSGAPLPRV
jgi:hypothetical protein